MSIIKIVIIHPQSFHVTYKIAIAWCLIYIFGFIVITLDVKDRPDTEGLSIWDRDKLIMNV